MLTAYPKIFKLETKYIQDIFKGPVEVTEKVDGSQFAFGKIDGQVLCRSRGAMIVPESCPKKFKNVVDYVNSISDRLPDGVAFYGETLNSPKHNVIKYDRVPKNHLALFGVQNLKSNLFFDIQSWAKILDIDCVPVLKSGQVDTIEQLKALFQTESFLGGSKIEGVVVKNYDRPFLLGGVVFPLMVGKLVREEFKELHKVAWSREKNKFQDFLDSMKSEARWNKAIQHLDDEAKLAWVVQDIGPLIKEINADLELEEIDEIKQFLWNHFRGDILRSATRGFPEWYKAKLTARSITDEKTEIETDAAEKV